MCSKFPALGILFPFFFQITCFKIWTCSSLWWYFHIILKLHFIVFLIIIVFILELHFNVVVFTVFVLVSVIVSILQCCLIKSSCNRCHTWQLCHAFVNLQVQICTIHLFFMKNFSQKLVNSVTEHKCNEPCHEITCTSP